MKLYLLVLPFVILLQGCFIEPDTGTDSQDDEEVVEEEQEAGDIITSLTVDVATAVNGDYPVAAKVEMRGALSATYELRLNGDLLESGTLPATSAQTAGPFSGVDSEDNYRVTYVTFGSAGDHEIELTLTKDGVTETRTASETIGSQCTGENVNWYSMSEIGVQSSFGSCDDCHTQDPDNSSFSTLEAWDKIQNSSDLYYVANAPANFDATPEANGGDYNHSGGERWAPDSSTHHRVIEMLYRMDTDFTCS